jgi:glyoxylase-like metal-dependent hydrolase (beta-lactamase superfamily II)
MKTDENKNKLGITVDYDDFTIIRPRLSYRINSSIIIIKGEQPVIIDTGLPFDPGIGRLKKALKMQNINPVDIKYLIITHFHPDHSFNLFQLEKVLKNAKVICHESDYKAIQNPVVFDHSYDLALKHAGENSLLKVLYSIFVPLFITSVGPLNFNPRIDYLVKSEPDNNETFNLSNLPRLYSGSLKLTIIHCPGHSAGHITVLDNNKNLYMGDFVPFTPWIDPTAKGLDDMIKSIKKILSLSSNDVELAIRAHGDFRREGSWEVSEWGEEKENFKLFLDVIFETLDGIKGFLKDNPQDINKITEKIIPQYLRYNKFLRIFYIPPSMSWSLAYCLKLEKMGEIKRSKRGRKLVWSA